MIYNDNPMCFSRYRSTDKNHEKNYRSIIAQYNKDNIINLMLFYLNINSVDLEDNNIDSIINLFVNKIIEFNYDNNYENRK